MISSIIAYLILLVFLVVALAVPLYICWALKTIITMLRQFFGMR